MPVRVIFLHNSGSVHVPRKTTSGGEQVAAASSVLARSSATTAKGKRARRTRGAICVMPAISQMVARRHRSRATVG